MKEAKKFVVVWGVWQFIEAIFLLVAGVLTIVFANNTDYYYAIGIIAGILIIVDASLRLGMHFFGANDEGTGSLFAVVGELTLGILLVSAADALIPIFTLFCGILLLSLSVILILDGISKLIAKKGKMIAPIMEFIVAALLIVAGILIVVSYAQKNTGATVAILIVIGAALIVLSIVEIVITVMMLKDAKDAKKAIDKVVEK